MTPFEAICCVDSDPHIVWVFSSLWVIVLGSQKVPQANIDVKRLLFEIRKVLALVLLLHDCENLAFEESARQLVLCLHQTLDHFWYLGPVFWQTPLLSLSYGHELAWLDDHWIVFRLARNKTQRPRRQFFLSCLWPYFSAFVDLARNNPFGAALNPDYV
jgi:hypothetical protein